jgi:hypothetical protein
MPLLSIERVAAGWPGHMAGPGAGSSNVATFIDVIVLTSPFPLDWSISRLSRARTRAVSGGAGSRIRRSQNRR